MGGFASLPVHFARGEDCFADKGFTQVHWPGALQSDSWWGPIGTVLQLLDQNNGLPTCVSGLQQLFWKISLHSTDLPQQSSLAMELRTCRVSLKSCNQMAENWLVHLGNHANASHRAKIDFFMMVLDSSLWGDGMLNTELGAWATFGSR